MARGIAQNVDSASKDGRPAFMNRLDTGAFNYDLRLQEYDGPVRSHVVAASALAPPPKGMPNSFPLLPTLTVSKLQV